MNTDYYNSGSKLLEHLNNSLVESGFPDEPSWGYAFTLLAALEKDASFESNNLAKKALDHLTRQAKSSRNYSWEFVVYALQSSIQISHEPTIAAVYSYNEKGTRMVNWTLLRQLNRLRENRDTIKAKFIIKAIKQFFTTKEGLILDEFKTRSLQYHAFCLFIICELDQHVPNLKLKSWLVNGCRFAAQSVLNDGTSLYIGRGQEQIFGYGSLIYSLEYVQAKYGEDYSSTIQKIWQKVRKFQRQDGSFPLVLNDRVPERPFVSFKLDQPPGWFGYNTLYDYQPFLAYCLLKASKLNTDKH